MISFHRFRTGRLPVSVIVAVGVCAGSLLAAPRSLQLDPAQTHVNFTLGAILHTVHGTFQLKSGNVQFDPETGAASGQVVVDATSGDSGSAARDRRMHEKILESAEYPEIIFAPSRVEGHLADQGDSEVQIHGMFTLHGQAHEITVPAQVHVAGNDISARMHFVVPYVSWGLKNPSTFLLRVSDKVEIDMNVAGRLAAAESHISQFAAPHF